MRCSNTVFYVYLRNLSQNWGKLSYIRHFMRKYWLFLLYTHFNDDKYMRIKQLSYSQNRQGWIYDWYENREAQLRIFRFQDEEELCCQGGELGWYWYGLCWSSQVHSFIFRYTASLWVIDFGVMLTLGNPRCVLFKR